MKISLALIVLLTAAVPAFAQTDSDTSGTGTSHGFAVSDGDTIKFGKQLIRLFGIDAPEKLQPEDLLARDGRVIVDVAERVRRTR